MARPSYDPDSLLVGVLGRPHGLDGEVTLRPYNQRGSRLAAAGSLILEQGDARDERRVLSARAAGELFLVRLAGVESRDAAAALTHSQVRVRRDALPALGPGEFFVEDILGCEVRTEPGAVLGLVESVFWNGAQDVMVVTSGKTEELIPLVPDFVRAVNVPAREVVVDWARSDDA